MSSAEKPTPEPSAEYAEAGMFAFRLDRSMHEDPHRKTIQLILDRDKDLLAAKQAELDAVKAELLQEKIATAAVTSVLNELKGVVAEQIVSQLNEDRLQRALKAEQELVRFKAIANSMEECADIWKTNNATLKRDLAQARAALAECQKDRERDYSRLIELLDRVVWEMDEHADFRNGNTDPTGSIDEGLVMHARFLAPFKDLLEQSRKRIDKAIASRAIIGGDAV